jgi:hypothetical protein
MTSRGLKIELARRRARPTTEQKLKVKPIVTTMTTPLHQAVEHATGDRPVHRELARRPWVLKDLVVSCCNLCFVISHFKLGDEHEADFVVLHGFSGGWDIHFIELEPPTISPFNREGNFSPRLNHAAGQIRRWKQFEDRPDKRPYLVSQLRDAVVRKDLLWHDGREPTDSQRCKLTDPESMLFMHYHVIMGRRGQLSFELMMRKAALARTDGFELITYDRVLDVYDRQRSDPSYEVA